VAQKITLKGYSAMTKREKFVAIMNDELDHDAIVEFCEAEIAALDKKAEKARERAAVKRAETDELKAVVADLLTDEPQTRDAITAMIDGEDVTVGKVGSRLTSLVHDGFAAKEKMQVEGADGKTKSVMGYKLA